MRRMLVTAGSTAVHIDEVRVVTNIFRGRTGEAIARAAAEAGWDVTLLTSRPEDVPPENTVVRTTNVRRVNPDRVAAALGAARTTMPEHMRRALAATPMGRGQADEGIRRFRYRTYDELAGLMERKVWSGGYDAIIHSAAVSDYQPAGVFRLDGKGRPVRLKNDGPSAAKIPSGHERLFIGLVPTLKLVDQIREPWGFRGTLVKFKLQVAMSDEELVAVAARSREQSDADFIVANCLEWSARRAYIIGRDGGACSVRRDGLATALLARLA